MFKSLLANGNRARFVQNGDKTLGACRRKLIDCLFDAVPIEAHVIVHDEKSASYQFGIEKFQARACRNVEVAIEMHKAYWLSVAAFVMLSGKYPAMVSTFADPTRARTASIEVSMKSLLRSRMFESIPVKSRSGRLLKVSNR
jgi:hypothetical protein